MARNQKSWGLKFVLASIVLLFCLAVTTVEGRSVPFLAQLTPENTGKVNSKNSEYVGQAFAYIASRGRSFRASILVVSNVDPKDVSNIQLYDVLNEELIANTTFKFIDEGYFALDTTIDADLNANINVENIAVYLYLSSVGTKRPALSGVLINNVNSHIVSLRADQEVTSPTGVSKNVGFASVILSGSGDAITASIVVNHDLNERVTSISLHAPAASNTENSAIIDIPVTSNGGKVIDVSVDGDLLYYLERHLAYINIFTNKNPAGALRGQVIPTTNQRLFTPTFANTATQGRLTYLPDGGILTGRLGLNLIRDSARNRTDNSTDNRVVEFSYNVDTSSFDNNFRFKLPVTLKNKYSVRGFSVYFRAAADASETGKYNVGIVNFGNNQEVDVKIPAIATTGRRDFGEEPFGFTINPSDFAEYLYPGGIQVNINGAALTGDLYVDQFYVTWYVNNAYANNILKSIFYSGSNLAD